MRNSVDIETPPDSAPEGTGPSPKSAPISLENFLENTPPGRRVDVAVGLNAYSVAPQKYMIRPVILRLYCEGCEGYRRFGKAEFGKAEAPNNTFILNEALPLNLKYRCRDCGKVEKLYALHIRATVEVSSLYKFGEIPDFGPPTPPKVISLIRDEREYYLKGRRSENQKDRIFAEVIRASKKVGAPTAMIADLETARKETQFHKAIESIKHGVPQALLIDGQNPLMLLHNALSEGLHAQTDDECLELATSIRVVLTELVDRMANVLADHAELKTAVSRLIEVKAKKKITAE